MKTGQASDVLYVIRIPFIGVELVTCHFMLNVSLFTTVDFFFVDLFGGTKTHHLCNFLLNKVHLNFVFKLQITYVPNFKIMLCFFSKYIVAIYCIAGK